LRAHRLIVASGFRIAGWGLGVPSSLSFLGFTAGSILLRRASAADKSHYLDINTYGLVGLLANGARGLGKVFEFLASVGAWVAAALAILSLFAILFSVILYFTGRGIDHQATWARIAAGLFSLCGLLFAIGAWFTFRGDAALVACLLISAFLYVLWVLGWKFA